jgi:hypothetical protein
MSTYFSRIIKAGDRQREFNFRQVVQDNDIKYHVDVPDDRGVRVYFQMTRTADGGWKAATDKLPGWITATEELLSTTIQEELHQLRA